MNIKNYLQILNISHDTYYERRYEVYKKKFGDELEKYQFENMIKNEPLDIMDNDYYYNFIQQYNPSKPV